jgi:hypothetical protein
VGDVKEQTVNMTGFTQSCKGILMKAALENLGIVVTGVWLWPGTYSIVKVNIYLSNQPVARDFGQEPAALPLEADV